MEFYVTRENSLSHKEDDELQHHGILGMKWGVRRYQNEDGTLTKAGAKRYATGRGQITSAGRKAISEAGEDSNLAKNIKQVAFDNNLKLNWYKAYNKASNDYFNPNIIKINEKYNGKDFGNIFETEAGQQYIKEVNNMWQKSYKKVLSEMFGNRPIDNTIDWVDQMPFMNQYLDFIKKEGD